MAITFKSFTQSSPLYEQSLILRNRVLIEAVGRHENCRDFDFPEKDIYIAAFLNDQMVAATIITPLDDKTVQMRQLAVDGKWQHRGIGKAIVKEFERITLQKGYSRVILHARESALSFYKALNYTLQGDQFYEIEIPHYEMFKIIKS